MDPKKGNSLREQGEYSFENTPKLCAAISNYDRLYGKTKKSFDRESLPAPLDYLLAKGLLKKSPRGEWVSIICPKHKGGAEKNASLRVSCIDGHFKCHACGLKDGDRPTPKTSDNRNPTGIDPFSGWFSLAKSSRINRQQKRGWQRGARR